eukprot:3941481-Rhodomonas_salina.5
MLLPGRVFTCGDGNYGQASAYERPMRCTVLTYHIVISSFERAMHCRVLVPVFRVVASAYEFDLGESSICLRACCAGLE